MSVRFSPVQRLFEKELRVSALQLCVMDAPQDWVFPDWLFGPPITVWRDHQALV